MLAVIDTNILVSALWSRNGSPAKVLSLVLNGKVIPCIDSRIMHEYRAVLSRPKFGVTGHEIDALLSWFEDYGFSVVPEPLEDAFKAFSIRPADCQCGHFLGDGSKIRASTVLSCKNACFSAGVFCWRLHAFLQSFLYRLYANFPNHHPVS